MSDSLSEYIEELRSLGKTDFEMLNEEEAAEFNRRLKKLQQMN